MQIKKTEDNDWYCIKIFWISKFTGKQEVGRESPQA